MIDLEDERNFVGILAGYDPHDPQSRCDGVAAAFNGQANDVLGIKINRIGSE